MCWTIEYAYSDVEVFIMGLSPKLQAKYFRLTDLMLALGSDLGMPHTRAMSGGLFELRITGDRLNARVFYCTCVGKQIVMLHGFLKKSQKTPQKELALAQRRMLEVKG